MPRSCGAHSGRWEGVTRRPRVVICVPDPNARAAASASLPAEAYEVFAFDDETDARAAIDTMEVEVVIAASTLRTRAGVDWLREVRRSDHEAKLALLAEAAIDPGVLVDAVNTAGVVKILRAPIVAETLRGDIDQAIRMFSDEVQRSRKLALSSVRVRRLTQSYEQACRDLARNRRELRALSHHAPRPPATTPTTRMDLSSTQVGDIRPNDPLADVAMPQLFARGLLDLLAETMERPPPRGNARRARRLAQHCAEQMLWSDEEVREVAVAAAIHHARLGHFPDEANLIQGKASHATALADRLDSAPGLESIAQMIRHHHHPWKDRRALNQVPRGTWLLAIISAYEMFFSDPALAKLEADDPLVRLTRASDQCLQLAGSMLHPEMTTEIIQHIIPRLNRRDEHCVALTSLAEGMVLSRAMYADQLRFMAAGTVVEARHIERIRATSRNLECGHCWVENSVAKATSPVSSDAAARPPRSASPSRELLTPIAAP